MLKILSVFGIMYVQIRVLFNNNINFKFNFEINVKFNKWFYVYKFF